MIGIGSFLQDPYIYLTISNTWSNLGHQIPRQLNFQPKQSFLYFFPIKISYVFLKKTNQNFLNFLEKTNQAKISYTFLKKPA